MTAKQKNTVRERLMEPGRDFSTSEMKVVRILLSNYPAAGLTTVSKLARQAGVSDPTALRVALRLDYKGYSEMQDDLLAEVEMQMRSPLTLSTETRAQNVSRKKSNTFQTFLTETIAQCEVAAQETATAEYEKIASLLADPRLRVFCLGGRFSRFIAGILQRSLHHLRENTFHVDATAADLVDELAMVTKKHVLVVFDYRRYQADVIDFASLAKGRGATVVLFTDNWKSPIAEFADIVLTAPTATASPFDTLATPLIQVEAIVAGVAHQLGGNWRSRAAQLEEVRNASAFRTVGGRSESRQSHNLKFLPKREKKK